MLSTSASYVIPANFQVAYVERKASGIHCRSCYTIKTTALAGLGAKNERAWLLEDIIILILGPPILHPMIFQKMLRLYIFTHYYLPRCCLRSCPIGRISFCFRASLRLGKPLTCQIFPQPQSLSCHQSSALDDFLASHYLTNTNRTVIGKLQ